MGLKDIVEIIGMWVGALLMTAFVVLTGIGSFRSCVVNINTINEAEAAIDRQPLILHWLPRATRFGIYEVTKLFAKEDYNVKKEGSEEEEYNIKEDDWVYVCERENCSYSINREVYRPEGGKEEVCVIIEPLTSGAKEKLMGDNLQEKQKNRAKLMIVVLKIDPKESSYAVEAEIISDENGEALFSKEHEERWQEAEEGSAYKEILKAASKL